MRVAFYKGKNSVFNYLIHWWDGGIYSHCEVVFSNGKSASASYRDGKQVRMKEITFDTDNWDFLDVPDYLEERAKIFFEKTKGMPYDLFGQIRFLIAPITGFKEKYWCSEWVAAALGMPESYRYGPNGLYAALEYIHKVEAKQQ